MSAGRDILIIDDDRDLVASLRIILESKDYRVRAAHNSAAGWKRMKEKAPDLLVLDVMMRTDTEGFDFAYKLKRNPRFSGIPILMLSAFPKRMAEMGPENFQHIMGEDWPIHQFLEKPVDPDELLAAVAALLSGEAPHERRA